VFPNLPSPLFVGWEIEVGKVFEPLFEPKKKGLSKSFRTSFPNLTTEKRFGNRKVFSNLRFRFKFEP
jgi:hypothetical protein